ncbi:diacylglycerol/lipid kinase family protein [Demequina sp.]|uniref:diacylglycerol/lipid kinase family protein n=1 Tax=Demequina sp. TaxID=2050685 RepID=UPI003D0D339D
MAELGLITNPTAASGRGAKWGAEAAAELARLGHRVRDLSRGSWAASYEAAIEHRDALDALIVVGGDGMVHLGAQVCAEHALPLGVMAAGSGNDVASTLKLPIHNMRAAAQRIEAGLRGDVTAVDVGRLTGPSVDHPSSPRYFLAVLSAGIDAAVAAYGSRLTFPRGPLKYKVATFREIPRYRPYGLTVTIGDSTPEVTRCTLVAVANTPVFGGGLVISPGSSMTDGLLEAVVTEPLTRREILQIFPKLRNGSHKGDPRIRTVQTTSVTIAQHQGGATLPVAFADGELVGAEPLVVDVAPLALRVLGGSPD